MVGKFLCSRVESLETRRMMASQPYAYSSVPIKGNGFIDGIVFSPKTSGKVFVHTDIGGAYRWDSAANKWQSMTDWATYDDAQAKSMGVETLAVDPNNGSRVYMGVGTYMSTTALMRSSDGGVTWARTNVPFHSNGNGSGRNTGERMMVDPNLPNVLYYGTRADGLWKSTDGGTSWGQVTSFPTLGDTSGYLDNTGIMWVLYDKNSSAGGTASRVIYAGVAVSAGGATRIYRSSDYGTSWQALPGGQYTAANTFPQRAALTPDGSKLYLTYSYSTSYGGPQGLSAGQIFRVDNPSAASPTWTNIKPAGWVAGASGITVDRSNPTTIYATEIDNYNPADRIWRSTNSGTSWTVMNPNDHKDTSSAPWAADQSIHWMGDIEIDPFNSNIAMFSTGFGVFRTTNLSAAQPNWTYFNEGLEESAVSEMTVPHTGSTQLLASILDRDGFRYTNLSTVPTTRFGDANNNTMGTNDDVDSAYWNANYVVRLGGVGNFAQYSNDNGVNWAYFGTPPTGSTGGGNIAISGDGATAVYSPSGTAKVFYATRSGTTWSAWKTPTSNQPADGAQVLADQQIGATLYAYQGTTVWRSTDGGANWAVRTTTAPQYGGKIRAVPGYGGNLIMPIGGAGLRLSTDGGATWGTIGSGAVTTANHVAVGAGSGGTAYPAIFVDGTVNGVKGFFRSDDQGTNWITISDAAHQYGAIKVLQADPRVYGRFFIGTNGRGIIQGNINGSISAARAQTVKASTATPAARTSGLAPTGSIASITKLVFSEDELRWS